MMAQTDLIPDRASDVDLASDPRRRRWEILLAADEAASALRAAMAVAEELATPPRVEQYGSSPCVRAELALLSCYLHRASPARGYGDAARRLIADAMRAVAETKIAPWLYDGFLEVAAIDAHIGTTTDDSLGLHDAIDEGFIAMLDDPAWQPKLDLIGGLVGLGVYWTQAAARPRAREGLRRLVSHLDARSERRAPGITWPTPWMRDWAGLTGDEPCFAVGVAHGIGGTIALLANIALLGVARERCIGLLTGAVEWLLAQPAGGRSRASQFPGLVGGPADRGDYFGWCWGDLGIVSSLLVAARAAGNERWRQGALDTGTRLAAESYRVKDGCLCHGAIGIAHQFNSMYQESGRPELREAAIAWFRRGLAQRHPTDGIAGFQRVESRDHVKHVFDDPTFVQGAIGIALGLVGGAAAVAPDWDQLMLMS